MKKKQLEGKRFGKLVVLAESERINGNIAWRCLCDCGKETQKMSVDLLAKRIRSCGCLRSPAGNLNKRFKGYGQVSGSMIYRIKRDALRRELEFDVTAKHLVEVFETQKGLCAITGIPIVLPANRIEERNYLYTASVDRQDNCKGYLDGNVQWVHKVVNRMKWDLAQEQFVEWCRIVVRSQG